MHKVSQTDLCRKCQNYFKFSGLNIGKVDSVLQNLFTRGRMKISFITRGGTRVPLNRRWPSSATSPSAPSVMNEYALLAASWPHCLFRRAGRCSQLCHCCANLHDMHKWIFSTDRLTERVQGQRLHSLVATDTYIRPLCQLQSNPINDL